MKNLKTVSLSIVSLIAAATIISCGGEGSNDNPEPSTKGDIKAKKAPIAAPSFLKSPASIALARIYKNGSQSDWESYCAGLDNKSQAKITKELKDAKKQIDKLSAKEKAGIPKDVIGDLPEEVTCPSSLKWSSSINEATLSKTLKRTEVKGSIVEGKTAVVTTILTMSDTSETQEELVPMIKKNGTWKIKG